MARSLDLARLGLGRVAPNPLVGAVIVHQGRIIGEGYHMIYGGPHAEVNAINSIQDPSLLSGSTLYVNLEPCNHHGLTPPCTDLILENSIPRVVIGQIDPNPLVGGKSVDRLKKRGVDVQFGLLEDEARELNCRFNTFHQEKRPFILLKWTQTLDGFVDTIRKNDDLEKPIWITDEHCRRMVHKWRAEESSIMVGTETALKDNPSLNIRSWTGKNPLRVVVDQHLRLPESLNLFDGSIPTCVYTAEDHVGRENLKYISVDFNNNVLLNILDDLYRRSIQSLMVEGGPKLLNSFIEKGLWDEARVFTGPVSFGRGVIAPAFAFAPDKQMETGNSRLEIFRKKLGLTNDK